MSDDARSCEGVVAPARHASRAPLAAAFGFGVLCTLAVTQLETSAHANRPGTFDRDDFHAALDDVLDRYVEPVDEGRLLSGGLKHIVAGLDAHSHYLTAQERRDLQKRARGGSTGLTTILHDSPLVYGGRCESPKRHPRAPGQHAKSEPVGRKDGVACSGASTEAHDFRDASLGRRLEIVSVDPGSPAAKAGLHPGDFVLAIGARPIEAFSHQTEVEAMLHGPIGDEVQLTVQRHDRPARTSLVLAYADHDVAPVDARVVQESQGAFLVLRIRSFRAGTGAIVRRELEEARHAKKALAGIILDLRDNPGGEVDEALVVADLFVRAGALTRTRGRGGRILREEFAHAAGTDETTPLIVLQNRHSASAAELLSAALQDHGRARVVGERSYGKGTVQQVTGLEDGSVLSLTIARYFSPDDRVIDGIGVNPDVDLPRVDDAEALRAALALFSARP